MSKGIYCKKHYGQRPETCPRCLEAKYKTEKRQAQFWFQAYQTATEKFEKADQLFITQKQEILFLRQALDHMISALGDNFKKILETTASKDEACGNKP